MDVRTTTPRPILLHATTAVNVVAGAINGTGSPAGSAGDTILLGVLILKNAAAVTLTIAGFEGEDGTARNVVLTGSTAADTLYSFPGLRNTGAAMTLTASVADLVLVFIQPA